MPTRAYLVFHLNMAFSSIAEADRPLVIARCYHPLLQLVEDSGIPIGIELSGWTLEQIRALDPTWIQWFSRLLSQRQCELIGSGYVQSIGPLAPASVNRWNQRFGIEIYQRLLGVKPGIALVNEMAFSSSLVDLYHRAGYRGLIMDRDNIRLALGAGRDEGATIPSHAVGPGGARLPMLWADSILFQKLQQVVHGDIRRSDYLEFVDRRISTSGRVLPVYANDAEVFDFRPGRFSAESPTHAGGEWLRLRVILDEMAQRTGIEWCSPSEALASVHEGEASTLTTAAQPVPVKKQAKYNLARWAVTGRDSTRINTLCFRMARALEAGRTGASREEQQRRLCRLWSSDLRTHITQARWDAACVEIEDLADALGVATCFGSESAHPDGEAAPACEPRDDLVSIRRDEEGILLSVSTRDVALNANLRRGLSLHSLSFESQGNVPIVGTLPHGYFDAISLGADFYTGGIIVELPGHHSRVTDLERVSPRIEWRPDAVRFTAVVSTRYGELVKTLTVPFQGEFVDLSYSFPGWAKPHGLVRVGNVTLLPGAFPGPLTLRCANGGDELEVFPISGTFDHGAASASLVSCTTGLGATTGLIDIGDGERRLVLSWDPALCAVLPMLVHKPSHPGSLTRVQFSILETDDTTRPGGSIGSMDLRLGSKRSPRLPLRDFARSVSPGDAS